MGVARVGTRFGRLWFDRPGSDRFWSRWFRSNRSWGARRTARAISG